MITFEQQGETCFIKGRLGQADVLDLCAQNQEWFTANTQVLDLSALEYVDSAGMAFMLTLIRDNGQNKSDKQYARKLINPSAQISKIIGLYDLDSFFN